ncbi:hypothetical protein G6F59_014415 [Rhizopus arrhizus]|nr:hypothetical protein G6F59_014415 [Rhizopus arrhizus]
MPSNMKLLMANPRALNSHFGNRDEVEILDALAGEHSQRLRGFTQGQRQLGGGVGAIDLVALGALGHHHPVQFGGGRRSVLCQRRRGGAGERQGEGVPAQDARVRVLHGLTFLVQEREDGRGAGLAGLRKLSQSTMAPAPAASTPHQPTKPCAAPQAVMLANRLASSPSAPSTCSRRRRGVGGAWPATSRGWRSIAMARQAKAAAANSSASTLMRPPRPAWWRVRCGACAAPARNGAPCARPTTGSRRSAAGRCRCRLWRHHRWPAH